MMRLLRPPRIAAIFLKGELRTEVSFLSDIHGDTDLLLTWVADGVIQGRLERNSYGQSDQCRIRPARANIADDNHSDMRDAGQLWWGWEQWVRYDSACFVARNHDRHYPRHNISSRRAERRASERRELLSSAKLVCGQRGHQLPRGALDSKRRTLDANRVADDQLV
jgi:hypothetical protein